MPFGSVDLHALVGQSSKEGGTSFLTMRIFTEKIDCPSAEASHFRVSFYQCRFKRFVNW